MKMEHTDFLKEISSKLTEINIALNKIFEKMCSEDQTKKTVLNLGDQLSNLIGKISTDADTNAIKKLYLMPTQSFTMDVEYANQYCLHGNDN